MLFKSLFGSKAQKACTGTGSASVCYLIGYDYYDAKTGKYVFTY